VSDDEVQFLTQGDAENEDVVMSLWHDNLKLLLVTDGEKGCRYFTKVYIYYSFLFLSVLINVI
jgi:fructokinase